MATPMTLRTERLTLEPLTPAHATELFAVFGDPVAMRYWHTLPHTTVAETTGMITTLISAPRACWWAFRRHEGVALGYVGYHGTVTPGMGYALRADAWGQGLAAEAVEAALSAGFTTLGLNRVELWIHAHNQSSWRLAERLGFTRRGQFWQRYPHAAAPHETLVYGLRADEWAARASFAPARPQREIAFTTVEPVIEVPDVAATVTYYTERLGFACEVMTGDPPSIAIVARGEWSVPAVRFCFVRSDAPIARSGRLYIIVSGAIDELHDHYRINGVTITQPLTTQPWGRREFGIADLNGQRLTFGVVI